MFCKFGVITVTFPASYIFTEGHWCIRYRFHKSDLYDDKIYSSSSNGGVENEGEDIEVLELNIDDAIAMINSGKIVDGKTIMLLQYAALNIF